MNWSAFLGVSTGYVIAQFFLVKLLKAKPPDPFGFLLTILCLIFLDFGTNAVMKDSWAMPFHDFLSIIAGCSVGQCITGKIFGGRKSC